METRETVESDQAQPSANNQSLLPDKKPQPKHCGGRNTNAEEPQKTTVPMYQRQNDEYTARQQHDSYEYVANSRVSYDGSDPDRGFTEDTPEPSVAESDSDPGHEDCDPPFCNDYHDSHMEVHKEFWDIVDSEHECNFCQKFCTVMQCPACDLQACTYCKDTYG